MEQQTERPVRKPVLHKKTVEFVHGVQEAPLFWVILTTLVNGFLAGVMVSLSSALYLTVDSRYLGAALSAIGYLVIFSYGFSLYTAKVGYMMTQNKLQNLMLIPIWVGNLLGALATAAIFRATRLSEKILTRGEEVCDNILTDSAGGVLLFALLCGFIFFLLSDRFKNGGTPAERYLPLIGLVMILTLCGFDHSIGNVFCFTVSGMWNARAVWYLVITVLGNTLGGLFIPVFHLGVRTMRGHYKNEKTDDKQ